VIRDVFVSAKRPLSPQEIADSAQETVPSLGIATVYRALREFVDEGSLIAVNAKGGVRYELSDIGHHHHFHCRECDKMFDIKGCLGNLSKLVPIGFVIAEHELTISGTCRTCSLQRLKRTKLS
jgi:Fur family ferric uptake transcriptional regulator